MHPVKPALPFGNRRGINGGPLFDLVALQGELRSGALDLGDANHVDVATDKCWEDLKKLKWNTKDHVTKLILLLKPGKGKQGDFINSQWCEDSEGRLHPCDSYRIRVDHCTWSRNANAPLYYLKFSIDDAGTLYLVLISCHLDKPKI